MYICFEFIALIFWYDIIIDTYINKQRSKTKNDQNKFIGPGKENKK